MSQRFKALLASSVGEGKTRDSQARAWIVTLSAVASIVGVAGGLFHTSLQYASEANARQAETELQVAKTFLETMEFAHGRSSYVWSEKCAEFLSSKISISGADGLAAIERYNEAFEHGCAMRLPVGAATQKAEIEMLAEFALRYPFLKNAAIAGLGELGRQEIGDGTAAAALSRIDAQVEK